MPSTPWGAAMWITIVNLVAGLLVLSHAGYKMNADMGLLPAITITLALAMDFFFLPPLPLKIENTGDPRTPIAGHRPPQPDHRSPGLALRICLRFQMRILFSRPERSMSAHGANSFNP